jgi:hypothetical protein
MSEAHRCALDGGAGETGTRPWRRPHLRRGGGSEPQRRARHSTGPRLPVEQSVVSAERKSERHDRHEPPANRLAADLPPVDSGGRPSRAPPAAQRAYRASDQIEHPGASPLTSPMISGGLELSRPAACLKVPSEARPRRTRSRGPRLTKTSTTSSSAAGANCSAGAATLY